MAIPRPAPRLAPVTTTTGLMFPMTLPAVSENYELGGGNGHSRSLGAAAIHIGLLRTQRHSVLETVAAGSGDGVDIVVAQILTSEANLRDRARGRRERVQACPIGAQACQRAGAEPCNPDIAVRI